MALPKLDVPIYELTLPSGRVVSFRPFLVKEEKILLMASQSKDETTILKSILQILTNCVTDDIKISDLPVFDIEYLFLNLRARSVGEIVDLRYRCNKLNDEGKACGHSSEYKVNLLDIKPQVYDSHRNTIQLTPKVGIILRPPKFQLMNKFHNAKAQDLSMLITTVLEDCIESIFDENSVYHTKDTPKSELQQFIDSLNPTQEKLINQYFEKMPKIEYTLKFECPKCGHKEDILVEGLNNFFT